MSKDEVSIAGFGYACKAICTAIYKPEGGARVIEWSLTALDIEPEAIR